MKGIFLYNKKISYDNLSGIDKKVLWQVDSLNDNTHKCILLNIQEKEKGYLDKILEKLIILIPYGNAYPKWRYIKEFEYVDFIYLRRPTCFTIYLIKLLKRIKKNNSKCKIVMEIPNYPYDKELLIKKRYLPLFIKDKYNRNKLKKYVDRIAVQNDIDEIFGIKTIKFINGIKVDDIEIRNPIKNNSNCINLCAIASLNAWQGYERVIKGIYNYYNNGGIREIIFRIVGSGSELNYYKKLVDDLDLNKYVIFCGSLYGKDLDNIYNISDIGLDAFGRYKTDNLISTSLKSREYLAKGLPIVSGCKVDILNENSPYYMEYESNSSNIDIDKIIKFYDSIYDNNKSIYEISNDIRNYAYKVCDISITMENIKQYLFNID